MKTAGLGLFIPFALVLGACTSTMTLTPIPGAGDAGPAGCTSDTGCSGATPRCDSATLRCVPCLPTRDNCGSGTHCAATGGSYACTAACAMATDCTATDAGVARACCNAACIDVSADLTNCGACGKACPIAASGTVACVSGACKLVACPAGTADCDADVANGCETKTDSDAKNCGACAKACGAGPNTTATCVNGACGSTCQAGFLHCSMSPADGCEVDGQKDTANCGACGTSCATLDHATGACQSGACALIACLPGWADCNGLPRDGCEADRMTDLQNCGACGTACPMAAHGSMACTGGACVVAACDAGHADCDHVAADGCETDLGTDVQSCGACGFGCFVPNGTPLCAGGHCGIGSCKTGYADCDQMTANGCESAIATDVMNCGGCGMACAVLPRATVACTNATCTIGACAFGWADCDLNPANGCESNLLDPTSCGQCGVACPALPHAAAACQAGACGLGTCITGYANCDGVAQNGCEKDVTTDVANCGGCGKACTVAGGTAACLQSTCGIIACTAPFLDCNSSYGDGCEVNPTSDTKNCGGCGMACPTLAHTTATCGAGQCGVGSCEALFGNCDGNAMNGCERSLGADVQNCGACGKVCATVPNATNRCTAGACGISACTAGFGDCNSSYGDGCEVNLNTSVTSCGACGAACAFANAAASCTAGRCTLGTCAQGYASCDHLDPNGCEANLQTDAMNCGTCGTVCAMGTSCTAGVCAAACTIVGSATLTNTISGWNTPGLVFHVLKSGTLSSFVFNNQGGADTVHLFDVTANIPIGLISTPAGQPTYTITISLPLVAGHSYHLTADGTGNGMWGSGGFPVSDAHITIDSSWGNSGQQTSYWFSFTQLRTCN